MSNNLSQPEQNSYFVFHDFEDSEAEGPEAPRSSWPAHVTVTPFFTLDSLEQADALTLIERVTNDALPIDIIPDKVAMYGPHHDIPVTTLTDPSGELRTYHTELVRALGSAGARFSDLDYALDNYSPHTSHKPGAPLLMDGTYMIRSISVGTKLNKPNPNKVIVEKFDL